MDWFSKKNKRIESVPAEERVVKTENVFVKCDGCEAHLFKGELDDNFQVCKHCSHHFRIGARERLALLFDEGKYEEMDAEVVSIDPLEFVDTKPYSDRIRQAKVSTGLPEAIINARGTIGDHPVVAGAMDMSFIGGSMGSAVGEKVTRLIERAMREHSAVVIFSASGGARMQEGTLSLMQMAKISAALAALDEARLGAHRSNNRRRNGEFCNAWRRHHCRTKSPHRFRWSTRNRTNHSPEASEGLSTIGVSARSRHG
jgi:acetyl-CoA carboxylase carboxyl transferase subunit beta